jgi:membrane protease YdiL (CAAX protease family)
MIPRFKHQSPDYQSPRNRFGYNTSGHHKSGCPIACPEPAEGSRFWDVGIEQSATAFLHSDTKLRSQQDAPTAPTVPTIPTVRDILPDGEAILQPPMDNTPNDAQEDAPHRIPHLGHAFLFLAIAGFLLLLTQLVLLAITHPAPGAHPTLSSNIPPKLLVGSEAFTYLTTLAISWFLFPLIWRRSFPDGIHANLDAARRNVIKLIPIGLVLSFTVQAVSSLATLPKNIPMDDFFRTQSDIWIITLFGTLLAPLFEEVLFRGFLLPAFAIAYDWLSLPRTPAARDLWQSSNKITMPALIFSAILTSILFTALHGEQVAYAWPVLCLLFCVSLVLTFIRLRLRSVMASTLVHMSYNFTIFLVAFIATDGYRHLDKMTH